MLRFKIVPANKVGCVPLWLSSLYCPIRNSDQVTIGKTHPTLQFVQANQNASYKLKAHLRQYGWKSKIPSSSSNFIPSLKIFLTPTASSPTTSPTTFNACDKSDLIRLFEIFSSISPHFTRLEIIFSRTSNFSKTVSVTFPFLYWNEVNITCRIDRS